MRFHPSGEYCLGSLGRTPIEQAAENLAQALRVLDLLPLSESHLTPHPVIILRAEIENARRYLALAQCGATSHPIRQAA